MVVVHRLYAFLAINRHVVHVHVRTDEETTEEGVLVFAGRDDLN